MPRGRSRSRSAPRTRSRAPSRSMSRPATTQGLTTAAYNRPKRGKGFSGKTVKSLINYVKTNLPAPEKKYKVFFNAAIVTYNAMAGQPNIAPVLINGLVRDDTVQGRTGDTINLGRGKLKGNFLIQNGVGVIRVQIILDKKPAGTALTNNELFGTATPSAISFLNFNNRDVYSRFTILAEQTFCVDDVIDDQQVTPLKCSSTLIDMSWNCNNYVASYKRGSTGTIGDFDDGAVYICVQQSETIGCNSGTPGGTLYGNYVQYYTDL